MQKRNWLILGGVLFVCFSGIILYLNREEAVKPMLVADPNLQLPTKGGETSYGLKDAPHELKIFFSPTCAHCAAYHREYMPQIMRDFVARGVVRFIPQTFATRPVDMLVLKICMCRGPQNMYPTFLKWLDRQSIWIPPLIEKDPNVKRENLKSMIDFVVTKTNFKRSEIVNALKIDPEDPQPRDYIVLFAMLDGYKIEEIIMALDDPKLEKEILNIKLKAVDSDGKLVKLIPAAYWDGTLLPGVPTIDDLNALISESHAKAASQQSKTKNSKEKEKSGTPSTQEAPPQSEQKAKT